MNCFSCFQSKKSRKSLSKSDHGAPVSAMCPETKKQKPEFPSNKIEETSHENIAAQAFTFREIASATKNFREECLLGEGGFGRAFKGTLNKQVVAVKQLDRSGMQGNKEFLVEVLMLSLLNHPNLVNLVGYCADGDQRLLVYEFMTGGSLQDHLFDLPPEKKPLDWFTRMRIALGAANGLQYLHDKANPPVVYGDLKPTNILLDENSNPRLSDYGLVKLSSGDKIHFSSRLMGTYGYSAPEYSRGGQLTLKSDVYSFGVILLELITGRRAIDPTKPVDEQNLVAWSQPIFRDPKRFPDMADPMLEKKFPEKDLNQAVAIAAMCLQEEPAARPLMSDVVTALSFLSMAAANPTMASPTPPPTPPSMELANHDNSDSDMSTRSKDGSGSSGHKCSRRMRNRDSDASLNGSNQGNVSSNSRDSSHYHNPCLSKKNSKDGSFSSPEKCNNDNQDLHDRSRSLSYSGRLPVGSTNSEDNR